MKYKIVLKISLFLGGLMSSLVKGGYTSLLDPFEDPSYDLNSLKVKSHSSPPFENPLDFRGKNLENFDFSYALLKGADFSESFLENVRFVGADLSKVNFENAFLKNVLFKDAILNGAKFKGAHLHNIHFEEATSLKGTLFEDFKSLSSKLTYGDNLHRIKKDFLEGTSPLFKLEDAFTLEKLQETLYEQLKDFHLQRNEYVILDCKDVSLVEKTTGSLNFSSREEEIEIAFEESQLFLKAPLFKEFVKKTVPLPEESILILFIIPFSHSFSQRTPIKLPPLLDLHGPLSLEMKYKQIDKFIKTSYSHRYPTIMIITGRGLHNPQGKMGELWKLCKEYLDQKKFIPYIQSFQSTSKNGGWKISLHQTSHPKRKSQTRRQTKENLKKNLKDLSKGH